MRFALQHRQAIKVGTHAAYKNSIAVVKQMVRGNRGARMRCTALHILRRLFGGDVLKHNFEFRKIFTQWDQLRINKHRFAVEQIDVL